MTQIAEQPKTELAKSDPQHMPSVPSRIPFHPVAYSSFGIDRGGWKALVEAIFPNAQSADSILLVLGYCRARKLDVFKRNVHIVPIWDSKQNRMVDTIWPGIGELRTTAFRTGEYAGRDATEFGQDITREFCGTVGKGQYAKEARETVTFPEWASVTVYRIIRGQRVAFAGPRVYWLETYSTQGRSDVPNDMWCNRPRGQLDKCAEAAALRAAFPEEVGSDHIVDEVGHIKAVDSTVTESPQRGPAGVLAKLRQAAGTDDQTDDTAAGTEPEHVDTATGEVVDASYETANPLPADAPATDQADEGTIPSSDEVLRSDLADMKPDERLVALRSKVIGWGHITGKQFDSAFFKWQTNNAKMADMSIDQWVMLWNACAAGKLTAAGVVEV